jgi:membrane protease YdiL (CAAX protease family)
MENNRLTIKGLIERIGLAVLFTAAGSLIIIVFSQYRPVLSGVYDLAGRIGLIVMLLIAALLARASRRLDRYWQLIFALFIMALAVSLDWWIARFLLESLGAYTDTPAGLALEKLKTGIIIAGTVIVLTRLSGSRLGSIYIQHGNWKRGLAVGIIAFLIAAAGSVPMSRLLFAGGDMTPAEVLKWAPWVAIAVLANATNEELLFRGLFLRKLEPFYGKFLSNCLIVLVFTGLHLGVTYTRDQMAFLVIVVPLALAWGYIMQKTDGVWGSILFHAGTDIPIFLAIFSTRF